MLKKFSVQHFKSLVRLELDLGRVNVFIGANGSGKSNILEAIGLLGAAASGTVDIESLARRGVRPGGATRYKSAFANLEQLPHIRLSAQSDASNYDITLWHPDARPGTPWRYKTEVLAGADGQDPISRSPASADEQKKDFLRGFAALKREELQGSDPRARLLDALDAFRIWEPVTAAMRRTDFGSTPIALDGSGLAQAVHPFREDGSDHLHAALEQALALTSWVHSVFLGHGMGSPAGPPELMFVDRFSHEDRNHVSALDASEGALHVLFCLVLALHPESPQVLAIDNFAQALNPRLAARLTERFLEWTAQGLDQRQVFLTTHMPAVLDALPLADDEVRLFAVDRTARGHTVARRIDLAQVAEKRPAEDWTLSRMWATGRLGAVPDV
ncbi:MAG: AAA family ATPase [Planctomycetes bacterium]|nr:AAA family ATPase [Planctomycetota bacterium]